MPLLEVQDLTMGYGALPVLGGISFEIEEGETGVLLGLNGAGKTTTVLTLAGLLRVHKPWGGRIIFQGTDITKFDARRRVEAGIVLVPEGRHVFPELTVAQNLRLGAWPHKRERRKTAEVLEQTVNYFPLLKERWTQAAGTLSGGEQQMLAIARGLMARPKLLLIDEASLGLSPKLTLTVFEVARRISSDGTTVFLVEQNAGALKLADRAFVMEKGTIVYQGHGDDILEHSDIRQAYLGAPT